MASLAPRFLLDTNICIFIAKNRPESVRRRLARRSLDELAMSVITLGELRYGAEKSQARDKALEIIMELSAIVPVFDLPQAAAEHYGDIRAKLQKRGTPIGGNDLWLAAHARSAGWTLVTHNVKEFIRVPGLVIENWAE